MGIKTTIVIFNEETNKHEPIAEGDILSETLLPPPRKAWLGDIAYGHSLFGYGTDNGTVPDLEVGSTYMVSKNDPTDDFSNVGQGTDESLPFVATGTTPAQWKNSTVFKIDTELTVTEHYNTIGFTVTGSLRIDNGYPYAFLATSTPYWNQPLAVYNSSILFPKSDIEAAFYGTNGKMGGRILLELL